MRELSEVVADILQCHDELAFAKVTKLRTWRNSYVASTDPTVTGRSREADINSTDVECTVIELDHKLQGLIEEKFCVLKYMDMGNV